MKRLFFFIALLIAHLSAFAQGFVVDDYHVDVFINQSGYFDVVENYEITFTESKHGIIRSIRTAYQLEELPGEILNHKIEISKIKVPRHPFEKPSTLQIKYSDQLDIKIGDENKRVTGRQQYQIKYRVKNAFLFDDDKAQFYWNLKGNDWLADFKQVSFKIHLPENPKLSRADFFIYSGKTGTTEPNENIQIDYSEGVLEGNTSFGQSISGSDNLTILLKLPSNYIKQPSALSLGIQKWAWLLFFPFIGIPFYIAWKRHGKNDYILKVVHYFPPEKMDPAMAGYLFNNQEDNSDLVSLIPYWGAKGLLSLDDIPKKGFFSSKDTRLNKLKDLSEDAASYEKEMFNGLFSNGKDEVLLSSLKDSFYRTMERSKKLLHQDAKKYYLQKSRDVYTITLVTLFSAVVISGFIAVYFFNIVAAVLIVLFCVALLLLTKYIKKRNEKGNQAAAAVYGFQMFVKTAEVEKLKILLAEDPGYFEKCLGFALTFGLVKKWADNFKDLNIQNPSWYHAGTAASFNSSNFTQSFSSSMSSLQSTLVSSPSSSGGGGSSGGGSSGGGFGGGGGRSW